jgi:hypothetical protein
MREYRVVETEEPLTGDANGSEFSRIAHLGERRAERISANNTIVQLLDFESIAIALYRRCPQHERARGSASRPLAASRHNLNLKALCNAVGRTYPLIGGKRTRFRKSPCARLGPNASTPASPHLGFPLKVRCSGPPRLS